MTPTIIGAALLGMSVGFIVGLYVGEQWEKWTQESSEDEHETVFMKDHK